MTKRLIHTVILLFMMMDLLAQTPRVNTRHHIGWYNLFSTLHLNQKWGIHTEYQWRRENVITNWQQSLLRIGLNFNTPLPGLQLRLGYAWAETFPYGDIPINSMGKSFSEHRIFQMVTIQDKLMRLEMTHRFMLEQRWVGRYSKASLDKEDQYVYMNRGRYQCKMQLPLKGKIIKTGIPYVLLFDEIFIGFGRNVGENIFDQNRISLQMGYALNKHCKFEAGYLNQTILLGREINNQQVFQYNHGLILNAIFQIRN
ncbi:MAG: DUF2490 domain-containing protein [Chitinophagaceae bacterium]|nr:DUF2490 domain-containing protein [Chitinophagaceae bacterium]